MTALHVFSIASLKHADLIVWLKARQEPSTPICHQLHQVLLPKIRATIIHRTVMFKTDFNESINVSNGRYVLWYKGHQTTVKVNVLRRVSGYVLKELSNLRRNL